FIEKEGLLWLVARAFVSRVFDKGFSARAFRSAIRILCVGFLAATRSNKVDKASAVVEPFRQN
ncbi:hypothetical protein U1Q18_029356, partial [Sarracenia purpurea var. burkii]